MKTNQCSGGDACIYSNMATDSTRTILRIVALDSEGFDIKKALIFRGFVLQNCTLYSFKKNEGLKRSPYFISRIPLLNNNITLLSSLNE